MTTVNSSKMRNAEMADSQRRIDFYRNVLAQYEKSKKQPAAKSNGSSTNVHTLQNTYVNVSTNTHASNRQVIRIASKDLRQPQSLSNVPKGAFSKRTVILNQIKSPVHKVPNLISGNLPVKPIAIKSTSSWKSSYEYKKVAVLNRPIAISLNSSNVPKLQSNLKDCASTSYSNAELANSSKLVEKAACLKSKIKAVKTKSESEILCREVMAMTEKFKQYSKSLSLKNSILKSNNTFCGNSKLYSRPARFSNLAKGTVSKNTFSSVAPNSSFTVPLYKNHKNYVKDACTSKATANLSYCNVTKNREFIPLESTSAKPNTRIPTSLDKEFLLLKATTSKPENCMKPIKQRNVQLSPLPTKIVRTPVSSKRKVTKLICSKFKVVNKSLPSLHTPGNGVLQKDTCTASNLQYKSRQWACRREKDANSFNERTRLLNSKYKVVNKSDLAGNLKANHSEFSSPKSLKVAKGIVSKRKSTFECMNKNKKFKAGDKFTFVSKSNEVASKRPFSSKLNSKISEIKNRRPLKNTKIRPLNSIASKYNVMNRTTKKSWCKVSKDVKSSSDKQFNFSTDVDLLMELAAEKNSRNSVPKLRNRSVLLKRVFKSKNTIINKNVDSARVKTAKMIKSKYLVGNRKHLWHKQARDKNFSCIRHFQGGHKSFQKKFSTAAFYNHRNKRNNFKHKISNFAKTSYFSRSARKEQYQPNKFAFGTLKSLKRVSGNRTVFSKSNVRKPSTPVSKSLASRVLQHSITRVLTASVKKKMSKVNKYCMFYNRFGRCNNGTKCLYIHDPSKIAICTRFLRGTCKAKNCLFSHEICPGKMAICSFFLSGSCTKANCPYRHEMLAPGAELCKAFVQGYCPKGKQCEKAHILVCPDYVKGFCSKGDACAFPHPPKEKKIIEKTAEKCGNLDTDEFLMERVSRYFQPSSEGTSGSQDQGSSSNSVIPKRKNLPEQPSFISLTFSDCES